MKKLQRYGVFAPALCLLVSLSLTCPAIADEVFLSNSLADSEAVYVIQFDTTASGRIRFFEIVFPDGINASTDLGRLEIAGSSVNGTITVTPPTTVRVRRPSTTTLSAGTKIRIEIFNLTNPLPGNYSLSITALLDDGVTSVGTISPIGFATLASGDITSVNPGTGLSGGGASGDVTLSVNTSEIQKRVVGTCPPEWAIREIDVTGNVVCEKDDNSGGTVTSVGTGSGLTGGPITTTGTISIAGPYQLPQGCPNLQVAKWNGTSWACAPDNDSGGDITGVSAGAGLAGGGLSGDVTLSVATGGITGVMIQDGAVGTANLYSIA